MLRLEKETLFVELPNGKTMAELNDMCRVEIDKLIKAGETYGKNIKIIGRITTAMALLLGHELSHICKSVSIYDPKEGNYVLVIKH